MSNAIVARLGIETGSMKRDLAKAEGIMATSAAKMRGLGAVAGSKMAGGFALLGGTAAITAAISGAIEYGSALRDSADALNLNVESLQELQFAFSQSGTSVEQTNKGLIKLVQSIDAAASGDKKAVAAFRTLGVSMDDLKKKSPDEVLMMVADGVKNAKDPTAALAATMDVLGKSGGRMAAGLREGAQGLRELRSEAATLSENEINLLEQAGDKITGFKNKVMVGWAAILTGSVFKKIPGLAASTPEELAAARAALKKTPEAAAEMSADAMKAQAAEDQLRVLEAEVRGQTEIAKAMATVLSFEKQIEEARKAGNAQLAQALVEQRNMTLEKQAQASLENARSATQMSLGELAGARGTGRAASQARRVMSLEEQAALARARGNEKRGDALQMRADELRKGLERRGAIPKTDNQRLKEALGGVEGLLQAIQTNGIPMKPRNL